MAITTMMLDDELEAFPRDEIEWLDTEGDGIDSNSDFKDDGMREAFEVENSLDRLLKEGEWPIAGQPEAAATQVSAKLSP